MTSFSHRWRLSAPALALVFSTALLGACSTPADDAPASASTSVNIDNCEETITFPSPAQRIFVNEGSVISNLFELDADDAIAAVAGLSPTRQSDIAEFYGEERVAQLPIVSEEYATIENVLAADPDVMIAEYNWGFDIEANLTPARLLADYDIPGYALSQTCANVLGNDYEPMAPLEAMKHDFANLGTIVGKEAATKVILAEIDERLAQLAAAPAPAELPKVLFDDLLLDDGILTGGAASAANAIIEAAGAENIFADLPGDGTTVAWEKIAATDPDVIIIGDFGGERGFDADIKKLQQNPATRNLKAVQEGRFIRLPGMVTRGTPLNVDAAEHVRKALEVYGLLPESSITPRIELDTRVPH